MLIRFSEVLTHLRQHLPDMAVGNAVEHLLAPPPLGLPCENDIPSLKARTRSADAKLITRLAPVESRRK